MTQVIKQFDSFTDAMWFIEDQYSGLFVTQFKAEILWVNNRWRVSIEAEAE